jgi:hypothetical protein
MKHKETPHDRRECGEDVIHSCYGFKYLVS